MTSDLVKRLREWDPMADDQPVYPDELLHEAADRIEALQKQAAEWQAEARSLHAAKFHDAARIEALEAAQAWRPIESAPAKEDMLVYIPTAKTRKVRVGRYGLEATGKRLWTYCGEFAFDVGKATNFLPLPTPPSDK